MRLELENIALCDRYLNREMNSTERYTFENQLANDEVLRNTLDDMRDLKTAILRKQIRERIEINGPGSGFNPYLLTTAIVLAVGMIAAILLYNPRPAPESERYSQSQVQSSPAENLSPDTITTTQSSQAPLPQYTLGGKKLWVEPDIQTFQFDSEKGATIEGRDGMVIFVPSNAFVDAHGELVSGRVKLRLVEALGISDMVLYKLRTVSNGSVIESGGMFYTDAEIDDTPVQINTKRPFYIEIPTAEEKPGMMIFSSEMDSAGAVNWIDPKPLKKFLVTKPLSDLDFLPQGFAAAVESSMPFLNYKTATSDLTDSLYYSLFWRRNKTLSEDVDSAASSDVSLPQYDANIGYGLYRCGIDPASVEALKDPRFQNSFIATDAFEARVRVLHKADNGEEMLQIYTQNLGRDLKIADSLVALQIQSGLKPQFEAFAKENLTNIEDGKMYAEQLGKYYTRKRAQNRDYHRRLAEKFSASDAEMLKSLRDSLRDIDRAKPFLWSDTRSTSPLINNSRSVYAAQWVAGGWGNIDRYMKRINSNSREVVIAVSDAFPNMEVTQWLGEINTYTDLIPNDGKYLARFPASLFNKNQNNHVFACTKTEGGFQWAFQMYSPKTKSEVFLDLKPATEAEIKSDLKNVEMKFGRLRDKLNREAAWQAAQIDQRLSLQTKRAEWGLRRKKIATAYNTELARQEEVNEVLYKLRTVAFPCEQKPPKKIENTNVRNVPLEIINSQKVFTIVEQMPSFPGGDEALKNYIQKHLKYPESALTAKISGVVYVTFVVNANGDIRDPKVLRSLSPDCDAAALNVVRKMPRWIPGKQRKTALPVQYNLPITFSLE